MASVQCAPKEVIRSVLNGLTKMLPNKRLTYLLLSDAKVRETKQSFVLVINKHEHTHVGVFW